MGYYMGDKEFALFRDRVDSAQSEEDLHRFLAGHPIVLRGTQLVQGGQHPAQFSKFRLADDFVPDFVSVAHRSIRSWDVEFVEIEPVSGVDPLFNRKGEPTGRLRGALTQIEDWAAWMDKFDQAIFVPKILERLKETGSWDSRPEFYQLSDGNHQDMVVWYRIVIGRRNDWEGHDEFRRRRRVESPTRLVLSHWDSLLEARA